MVGPDQLFSGQLVELVGQPFGQPPRVAEHDRGVVLADQLQDLGVDRRPDAVTGLRASGRAGGTVAGRQQLVEPGHLLDGDADAELQGLARAGIHDLDVARLPCPARPDAAQETGDRLDRPLRGRETDLLRGSESQLLQPLQAEGEVRATLGASKSVYLVHDDVLDAAQNLGRLAGQDQVERLGRGDQDVGRVADQVAAFIRRRVARADPDLDPRRRLAQPLRCEPHPGQRRPQVALDVVDQSLERRDVQDSDGRRPRPRLPRQPIEGPEEGGEGLAAARRGVDKGVAPGRNARPAADLGRGRRRERRAEPLGRGRAEDVQRVAAPGARFGRRGHEAHSISSADELDHAF